ncbi:DUF4270 domain-containing protein [Flagellimonas sp. GZD32]|uniref:DUF4270 domain-containing protein n=1 Tax=Flagellimonas cixiensis TaxID=3228750 RepID=UPI0035C897C8
MRFSKVFKVSAVVAGTLFLSMTSCEDELETIGSGVIDGEPFSTGKIEYDVFAYNKGITAVQTNRLSLYQLGTFNDPVYGKRKASIISQITLPSTSPTFGGLSQEVEDNADSDESVSTIEENETVKEVYLYIPFQLPPSGDSDGDGVDDEFESGDDVDDPNSDWDNDGVTDNQERILGSNPFDPEDTGSQEGFVSNNFPNRFDLDSIYGDREQTFNLTVSRSNYLLRDLDPNSGFQETQEYYSNQDFSSFIGETLFSGEVTVSNEEYLFYDDEDDPDTEDVDESTVISSRLNPGIRVPLNNQFFQENILDKEGSSELLSQSNFTNFIRGIHLTGSDMEELMFLLNLSEANITITYEYQDYDPEEEELVTAESEFVLNFLQAGTNSILGNAVNVFENEAYPADIASALDNEENASRIYVKGGATQTEIRLFSALENGGGDIINQIKQNNWIINEANLVFYVDREALDASGNMLYEPQRLYLYNQETNRPLYDVNNEFQRPENTINPLDYYSNYDGVLEKNNNKGYRYTIRITEHINNIIVRDSVNAKLGLTSTANVAFTTVQEAPTSVGGILDYPVAATISPLGTVLYGNNVAAGEEDMQLKLEIFYTEAN